MTDPTNNTGEEVQETPEAPAQGQVTEQEQVQAEQAAPAQGAGPWANDLAKVFEDEGVRGQVDSFLRSTVQPHVTRLEQASQVNEDAAKLYADFQDNPGGTYLAVTEELFGDDLTEIIRNHLAGEDADEAVEDETEEVHEGSNLDPRLAKLLEKEDLREQREQYEVELARIRETDPQLDPELLAPFVVAADGDVDTAYAGYKQWLEKAGVQGTAAEEVVADEPPAVLGSDSESPSSPPVRKDYGGSLDAALDDFFAETKGKGDPAPPVGSV